MIMMVENNNKFTVKCVGPPVIGLWFTVIVVVIDRIVPHKQRDIKQVIYYFT